MKTSITAKELESKIRNGEEVKIIDVRTQQEYASGHIPESQWIILGELPEVIDTLSKEETYYIICHSGGRSRRGTAFLNSLGFKALNVSGGIIGWKGNIAHGL